MIYSNDSFTKLFSTSPWISEHTEIAESVPCRGTVTNVLTYSVSLFTLTLRLSLWPISIVRNLLKAPQRDEYYFRQSVVHSTVNHRQQLLHVHSHSSTLSWGQGLGAKQSGVGWGGVGWLTNELITWRRLHYWGAIFKLSATFEFKLVLKQNVPASGHLRRTCEGFAIFNSRRER